MEKYQHLYTLKQKAGEHMKDKKFSYAMVYLCDALNEFDKLVEDIEDEDLMLKLIEEIKFPCHKNLSLCYLKQANYPLCIQQCK